MSSKYFRRARLWVAAYARAGAVEQRLSRAPDGFDFDVFAGGAHAHYEAILPSSLAAGGETPETTAGTCDVSAALATGAE